MVNPPHFQTETLPKNRVFPRGSVSAAIKIEQIQNIIRPFVKKTLQFNMLKISTEVLMFFGLLPSR